VPWCLDEVLSCGYRRCIPQRKDKIQREESWRVPQPRLNSEGVPREGNGQTTDYWLSMRSKDCIISFFNDSIFCRFTSSESCLSRLIRSISALSL
jgi:hypothetical protein